MINAGDVERLFNIRNVVFADGVALLAFRFFEEVDSADRYRVASAIINGIGRCRI